MNAILRCALAVAAALPGWRAEGQDPGKKPEEPPKNPMGVYTVTATVRSRGMHWKDSFTKFRDRLQKQLPHVEYKRTVGIGEPTEKLEAWTFEVDARKALNPGVLRRVFLDLKVHRLDIVVKGTAVRSEKVPERIDFICHHSSWKVRLQPLKRREGEPVKGDDLIGKIARGVDTGRSHYQLRGELTWTEAGHTIVVEEVVGIDAPPRPEGLK